MTQKIPQKMTEKIMQQMADKIPQKMTEKSTNNYGEPNFPKGVRASRAPPWESCVFHHFCLIYIIFCWICSVILLDFFYHFCWRSLLLVVSAAVSGRLFRGDYVIIRGHLALFWQPHQIS